MQNEMCYHLTEKLTMRLFNLDYLNINIIISILTRNANKYHFYLILNLSFVFENVFYIFELHIGYHLFNFIIFLYHLI